MHFSILLTTALAALSIAAPAQIYEAETDRTFNVWSEEEIAEAIAASSFPITKEDSPDFGDPFDAFNISASPNLGVEKREAPELILTMSRKRQHVGRLISDSLRWWIYGTLLKMCPTNRNDEDACNKQYNAIYNIEYNAKGHKAFNAHLTVWVNDANLPELYNQLPRPEGGPGLNEVFAFSIAQIFARQSENEKNCYTVRLAKDKDHSTDYDQNWCNVGHAVKLSTNWAKDAHMDVYVEFNGKTLEGPFDCQGSQSPAYDVLQSQSDNFRKAFRLGAQPMPSITMDCDDS